MREEKWRWKRWTAEYHKRHCVIDFSDVRRFSDGYVTFKWPGGKVARAQMITDYGGYQFWPGSLQKWADGSEITDYEKVELTAAIFEWGNDEKVPRIEIMDAFDVGDRARRLVTKRSER